MTRAVAGRTDDGAPQHAHAVFDRLARRALPFLFKLCDHTFKIGHAEYVALRLVRTIEHIVFDIRGKLLKSDIQRKAQKARGRRQIRKIGSVLRRTAAHGSLPQRQSCVAYHQCRIESFDFPRALAHGASSERVIKREHRGTQIRRRSLANRTAIARVKHPTFTVVHSQIGCATVSGLDGRFKAFGQTRTLRVGTFESINHDVDRVTRRRLGEHFLRHIVDRICLTIEQKTQKATLGQLFAHFGKRNGSRDFQRRQNQNASSFFKPQHSVNHVVYAAFLQRHVVLGTVRHTNSRKQHAQIVVDFGHRAHR